eukprot:CAMPEP_0170513278 /NCGR_PEP_ID=MMETSP0208-20121228/67314_1 /TAXON_ID=197538 /ORGANISM="Strombidium inclinatum, Strain S3" /LENGTH=96 /DNA_ID=CAMNT_0010796997 /DNA_START=969 /DNA_END=1259 /DNA_ORIENTATION=-
MNSNFEFLKMASKTLTASAEGAAADMKKLVEGHSGSLGGRSILFEEDGKKANEKNKMNFRVRSSHNYRKPKTSQNRTRGGALAAVTTGLLKGAARE